MRKKRLWGLEAQRHFGTPPWDRNYNSVESREAWRFALGSFHENGTNDVPTTSLRMWACPRCCTVVKNGDIIGNRASDAVDINNESAPEMGWRATELPEYQVPYNDWERTNEKA